MNELQQFRNLVKKLIKESYFDIDSTLGGVSDVNYVDRAAKHVNPYRNVLQAVKQDFGSDSNFYKNLFQVTHKPQIDAVEVEKVVRAHDKGNKYLGMLNLTESNFDLSNSGIVQYLNNYGVRSASQISTLQDVINLMLTDEQFRAQAYPNGYKVTDVINDVLKFFDNPDKALDMIREKNPVHYANNLKTAILKRKGVINEY